MKKTLLIAAACCAALYSCKKTESPATLQQAGNNFKTTAVNEYPVKPTDTLSGTYDGTPVHLTSDKTWYLDGPVIISNTTITIDAGTIITGVTPGKTISPDVLVIENNAKIIAKGTADQPIVFTSKHMIDGNAGTNPAYGDMGGLIVLGGAPAAVYGGAFSITTNKPYPDDWLLIDCGGNNVNHSSGELSFVRVEYGGVASGDNLWSGFSLIGVGKGTKVDHIESAYSALYGFQVEGGSFDATYLLSVGSRQDGMYLSANHTGSFDYGVILKATGTLNGSSGILLGGSTARLNHFTIVGEDKKIDNDQFSAGIQLNGTNAKLHLQNSIILGYNNGLYLWASRFINEFKSGASSAKNNIITGTVTAANFNTLNSYLDANGNKRYVWATKANSFTRLRQPFIKVTNDPVNLVPLSVSPANQGTTDQAGAFNDYSRPATRWGHAKAWFRLYY